LHPNRFAAYYEGFECSAIVVAFAVAEEVGVAGLFDYAIDLDM
jgi:hypothetical protein